jgi:hypothetical protein
MTFAARSILGISVLFGASVAFGCSGSSSNGGGSGTGGGGPVVVTGGTAGTGGASGGTAGTGGTPPVVEGVPLIWTDGWIDSAANSLGVVGAVFDFGDNHSTRTANIAGADACISGEAAMVDMNCTPMAPATDCYGEFWGTAIGINVNQPIDPVTMMGVETPMAFDFTAKGVTGFTFDITGTTVPTSLRFKVEDSSATEYCTPSLVPVLPGTNTIRFSDLLSQCWDPALGGTAPTGSDVVKIAWAVVTNSSSAVPYDFCIANLVAISN